MLLIEDCSKIATAFLHNKKELDEMFILLIQNIDNTGYFREQDIIGQYALTYFYLKQEKADVVITYLFENMEDYDHVWESAIFALIINDLYKSQSKLKEVPFFTDDQVKKVKEMYDGFQFQ